MNTKRLYLLIGAVLVAGFLPQKNVSADMGPKPTMDFQFMQEISGSKLTMVSWSLNNCEISECASTEEIIPVEYGFKCADNFCSAGMYYGIRHKYFQMEITFSDGVTRKSNVFTRRFFDARYRVTIQTDSLLVKELKGSNINEYLLVIIFDSMLYFPIMIGVIFIIAIGLAVYSAIKKEGPGMFSKRIGKVLWWVLVFTFIVLGLLVSASTFVATMAIELLTAFAILKYIKVPLKKILYGVLIANIFTQPLFAIASTTVLTSFISAMVLEIIIWLVETAIVNRIQDKQMPLKNIALMVLVLNALSFGIGLLLPI